MRHIQLFARGFFALTFSAWLGRADLRTDDTGILVGLIGIGGFVLSLFEPRRPWVWGVLVPSGIIFVELWRNTQRPISLLAITGVTLAIGCAGAYAGAFIRRHVASAR